MLKYGEKIRTAVRLSESERNSVSSCSLYWRKCSCKRQRNSHWNGSFCENFDDFSFFRRRPPDGVNAKVSMQEPKCEIKSNVIMEKKISWDSETNHDSRVIWVNECFQQKLKCCIKFWHVSHLRVYGVKRMHWYRLLKLLKGRKLRKDDSRLFIRAFLIFRLFTLARNW